MNMLTQIENQKRAAAILQRAILADRVSHAWLLCGPLAEDLEALALAFAASLLCTGRPEGSADACMTCKSCLQAADGNHPDLRVWSHEKPKAYSVAEIRALVSDVSIRPFSSGRKIYIIPEAHLMRQDAQNMLLKTLEEPPEYVVLLLLAQSADAMLETVRSRCQKIELAPRPAILDPELSRIAEDLLFSRDSRDLSSIRQMIRELEPCKVQAEEFLALLTSWYRDLLYCKAAGDPAGLLHPEKADAILSAASHMSFGEIRQVLDHIKTAHLQLRANVRFDLTMELLFLAIQESLS